MSLGKPPRLDQIFQKYDPPVYFVTFCTNHRGKVSEKWEYVHQNPVRAGLVSDADQWPDQGEIVAIEHS